MRAVVLALSGLIGWGAVPLAAPIASAQTVAEPEGTDVMGRAKENAAGFRDWVTGFRSTALAAGVPAATYDREMRSAVFLPDVVRRDRNQNEFTKTIWDYLDIAVSEERVRLGREAIARHAELLRQIEDKTGVEGRIIVAVWGLETSYGAWRGDTDTISALATLAYDGRRADFFAEQLIEALRILEAGEVPRAKMLGSWAGAMGHTQFMPTSWRDLAVDFDGDGKRDLWGVDPSDALASTAAYLAQHGWTSGMPWGMEVRLPPGFDYDQSSEKVVKSADAWRGLGVVPVQGGSLPEGERVSILLPAGASGPAFAIWPNFQAIESYNPADAYVIAVGHLADRIAGGPALVADWPRQWRALTLAERHELQEMLIAAGYLAPGGVDGRIGPKTVAAVKAWQRKTGRVPDGYPSPDVLAALRAQ